MNLLVGWIADGREWYTSFFGNQKWFHPGNGPLFGFLWTMNDYNGAYNFGDHYGYRIPDLTVKCKWPVWKSDGTLNKLHPTYKKRMRKHAGEEKYAAEQRAWEGPGLINKGLPTMAATVTIITTGGLGSVGAISGWEYAVPTISATNSIYSAIVAALVNIIII